MEFEWALLGVTEEVRSVAGRNGPVRAQEQPAPGPGGVRAFHRIGARFPGEAEDDKVATRDSSGCDDRVVGERNVGTPGRPALLVYPRAEPGRPGLRGTSRGGDEVGLARQYEVLGHEKPGGHRGVVVRRCVHPA